MAERQSPDTPLTKRADDRNAGEIPNANRDPLGAANTPTGAGSEANPYDQLPRTPDDARGEVF